MIRASVRRGYYGQSHDPVRSRSLAYSRPESGEIVSLPHSDFVYFHVRFVMIFDISVLSDISLAPKRPSRYDFGHFRTCRYFGLSGQGRPLEVSLRAGQNPENGPEARRMHRSAPNFLGRLVRRCRALVPSFEPITEGTPKNRPSVGLSFFFFTKRRKSAQRPYR